MCDQIYALHDIKTQSKNDRLYKSRVSEYFQVASGTNLDKLQNFARFVPRQTLSLFLAKNEIFKKIIGIHGVIVECGVFMGGGLFTWAQLSAIYEPVNHNRKIIGFDSFCGFPQITPKDFSENDRQNIAYKTEGGYSFDGEQELQVGIDLFDLNRPIGHMPKIELVKGDATETIPSYLDDNPHLVVSLVYLDFDLYEPTRTALETLLPRMSKGSILAFDELNQAQWPGETRAVLEQVGLRNLRIERFPFTPSLSYAVLD